MLKSWTKSILFISKNEEENCKQEKYYITLYNAVSNPIFYNIHEGGSGCNTTAGYMDEQRQALKKKLSELNIDKKNGMYGKQHSEKTKAFLSYWAEFERDNSVYRTDEFRSKMSAVTSREKNGMYGKSVIKHLMENKLKCMMKTII